MVAARRTMARRRAFTLLEVLVAVAILGLGLTVILSSQVGLFAGVARGRSLGFAANLARCRMSELELELLKNGYPIMDQSEDGPCCEDESDGTFGCAWKIELVELPEPPLGSIEDPMEALFSGDGGLGPMGALQDLQTSGAGALTGDGMSGITEMFAQQGSMGTDGIASMAMPLVYPELKPMLEASIRKLTVTVRWKEGRRDEELVVVQYVTNPMQGAMDPEAADLSGVFGDDPGAATGSPTPAVSGRSTSSRARASPGGVK